MNSETKAEYFHFSINYILYKVQTSGFCFCEKMFWLVYINVQKITHLAQNVKYFSYSLDDSFSQLSKEVRLLCWDSRKSKQRKWSDVFQKIQVDVNFILICGTKLRTFKQKVRPQWILLWCIFMWKKLGTNLSTPWTIYY